LSCGISGTRASMCTEGGGRGRWPPMAKETKSSRKRKIGHNKWTPEFSNAMSYVARVKVEPLVSNFQKI